MLGLLVLAPLVGEYELGNISIRALPGLPSLVPMYGGGALLIRKVARRAGRGWGTVLLFKIRPMPSAHLFVTWLRMRLTVP